MAIKIQTGPMPAMAPARMGAGARSELQQAILDMPPGSWFIVPDTAGKKGRQLLGPKSGITRFVKRMKLSGIATGLAADGSGLIVRKTGELDTPARPQTSAAPPPRPGSGLRASKI